MQWLIPCLSLEDHLVLGSTEDVDTWILLPERCHINFKWRFKLGRLTALPLRVLSGDLSLSPTESWLEMQTCSPLALCISTQIHSDFSALTLTFETPRPHSPAKSWNFITFTDQFYKCFYFFFSFWMSSFLITIDVTEFHLRLPVAVTDT